MSSITDALKSLFIPPAASSPEPGTVTGAEGAAPAWDPVAVFPDTFERPQVTPVGENTNTSGTASATRGGGEHSDEDPAV